MDKPILDATCGGRMMWFDKSNPACLYLDKRTIPETVLGDNRRFSVTPDIVADFTKLPFDSNLFYLVVFDPPHLIRAGDDSYLNIIYGRLTDDWEIVIAKGFAECMRVLRPCGTLIFKWSEIQIPTKKVIATIGVEPLFGHRSGKKMNTHWMVFMKNETTDYTDRKNEMPQV